MTMWSTVFVLVVLTVMAVTQAAPKETLQYKSKNLDNIKSPKRQTSSLVLGGRFGRSCLLMAGGCLGKRSKPWEMARFNLDDSDMVVDDSRDFNLANDLNPLALRSPSDRNEKSDNQRIINQLLQRLYPLTASEDKLQRMPDQDYASFYLQ